MRRLWRQYPQPRPKARPRQMCLDRYLMRISRITSERNSAVQFIRGVHLSATRRYVGFRRRYARDVRRIGNGQLFFHLGSSACERKILFAGRRAALQGAHPVAVPNYGTWATRFGSNPDILGKPLRINDIVFTVVGVAPPQFIGMNAIFGPDVWIPAAMTEQLFPNTMAAALHDRTQSVFLSVGRLKSGVTEIQAQAEPRR